MQIHRKLGERILRQTPLSEGIRLLAEEFERQARTMTVVQVGACNGKIGNDHLQEVIKGKPYVRAHLIEAVRWLYDELVDVMRPYEDYIQCHNVAIAASDGLRTFYWVSPQFGMDEPDRPAWQRYQIGGLHRENLSVHVPDRYIESARMRCRAPATFLAEAGITAQQLNVLVVDAEGEDAEIVNGFLESTEPQLIVYEHKILPPAKQERLRELLTSRNCRHRVLNEDTLALREAD